MLTQTTKRPTTTLPLVALLCLQFAVVRATVSAQEWDPLQESIRRIEQLELEVQRLSMTTHAVPYASASCTPVPCVTGPCESECIEIVRDPVVCGGWEGSAEFLYLKPRQRGLDFAATEDGTALVLGNGDIHNLDYDREGGFRASIGYRTKTRWGLIVSHTNFATDGVAYAERPDGIGQLFATRSHPDGTQEANTARMASSLDYELFDVMLDRPFYDTRFATLSAFGGVRFVDFAQDFQYDYDGRDFINGRIIDRTRMDGVGLRLGSEGRWNLPRGLSLFGRFAGGITYGRYETQFFEDNLDGQVLITEMRDQYEQAISSLEAALGVSWQWKSLRISGGYEMINWFNLSERAGYVDDIQEATYIPLSQDMLLEGLFLQLALVR